MTKLHEDFRDGTLAELRDHYAAAPPRGEVTVVVAGTGDGAGERPEPTPDADEVAALIRSRLAAGDSRKDVVRAVATRFGLPRNEAYRWVVTSS